MILHKIQNGKYSNRTLKHEKKHSRKLRKWNKITSISMAKSCQGCQWKILLFIRLARKNKALTSRRKSVKFPLLFFLKKFMKTNINLEELERKNNMVLQNLERFSKYFPNIGDCATSLAEAIEEIKFEREMGNFNF